MTNEGNVDVVVVLDGRPGHEKQTLGIVDALAGLLPVKRHVINVSGRSLISQVYSYGELMFGLPIQIQNLPSKIDLVIGTGSRTHTTVLNIKKRYGAPAVTCMTPNIHIRNSFDICFVPEHDGAQRRNNYFFTLGAPNSNSNKSQHREDKGLILIGGVDVKSHSWDSTEIAEKIELVVAKEADIQWKISSSPRTPEETVSCVKEIEKKHPNCTFFDFKDTPKGWVEKQYDLCATVWVTADSISMLYEALSSGCRVNIFPMVWKKSSSKFRRNEQLLTEKQLVSTFEQWQKGAVTHSKISHLNEAQRCAEHIVHTCLKIN